MSAFRLAYLSLIRHRFSTYTTLVALGLSVACCGVLLRLYQVSEGRFSAFGKGGDAVIGAKAGGIEILLGSLNAEGEFPDFLPYPLFESLRTQQTHQFEDGSSASAKTIQSVIPFLYFARLGNSLAIGTDDSFFNRPRVEDSLTLESGRWFSAEGEVVLGHEVARKKNLRVGDSVSLDPWLKDPSSFLAQNFELKIVGVLKPSLSVWDKSLFSSVRQAQLVLLQNPSELSSRSIWGANVLHYFLVYLHPGGYPDLRSLVNRRTVGQAILIDEQMARLKELSGVGKKIGLFVTVFILVLGGLLVSTMLWTRFDGMSLQIAVLRALGYSRFEIFKWLLWEGFILGGVGIVIGASLDFIAFPILRGLLGTALPPADLVSSSILGSLAIWLITMLAVIVSVLIPMFRISRQDAHADLLGH